MDADFVSFGRSPSPPPAAAPSPRQQPNAEAGPSKPKKAGQANTPQANSPATKGKKRGRAKDDEGPGPRNLKEERKAKERSAPWCYDVDWTSCRDPAEMLNQEITAFYNHMSPTRPEFEVRFFVIEMITRAIHSIWPNADVTPFGSWQTQLYLPSGDIDLVVTKDFTESNKVRTLSDMARAMRQAKIADTVAIISKARVPIIKFITNEGRLNVDISLNQANGVAAAKIVNQYLDVLPGARQLILVVKAFLSQRSMNEVYTGGLGSYSVICLVISFLQIHPKLRRREMDPERNLGTLLMEFFELYGKNYNYDEVGIAIRRGGFYYSKRARGWYQGNKAYLLSVEDPQDPDNDISGGSFGIRQVRLTLNGAFNILQEKLCIRANEMIAGRDWQKSAEDDPEELSILSAVMGVTRETTRHRDELNKLHREGRLQRILHIPARAIFSDHFPEAQALRDSSTLDRTKRPATTPNSKANSKSKGSVKDDTPTRARRGSPLIQAIVVDDDEVGEFDDSSDPDQDLHNSDGEYEVIERDKDTEDLHVKFSNGHRGYFRGDDGRYESYSEQETDEDEDDEKEASRYSILKASANAKNAERRKKIEEERKPTMTQAEKRAKAKKQQEQGKRNRDFWAAKAGDGGESSSDGYELIGSDDD